MLIYDNISQRWYDKICVIAEDDPVRILRLSSAHVWYNALVQLPSDNCPYAMHITVCVQYGMQGVW